MFRLKTAWRRTLLLTPLAILLQNAAQSQWIPTATGLPTWNIADALDACDSNTAVISIDPGVYLTVDGGTSWRSIGPPGKAIYDLAIVDSSHIWLASGAGEILATTNGGQTWDRQYLDSTKCRFMNYVRMFDLNNGVAMGDGIVDSGPALFISTTDGGNTWISKNDSAFGGLSYNIWTQVSFVDRDTGYFFEMGVNPNRLYRTNDAGATWHITNYPLTNAQIVSFSTGNIGLATPWFADQSVYRTLDGGTTWESFQSPRIGWGGMDIAYAPGDPSMVWMADEGGQMLHSDDTGRTWTVQLSVGGHNQLRDVAIISPTHGWLLGDGGRIYRTSNGGDPPSDAKLDRVLVPAGFALDQNYPNPFNGTTNIGFRIPSRTHIVLKVYDLLGREIATLVNEERQPGSYSVSFDARDLATGVYAYRITAGAIVHSRTMLLLR